MNKNSALTIFSMLDPSCVIKQFELDPNFKENFLERAKILQNFKFSESQFNRLFRLVRELSKAFLEEAFDYSVIDVLHAFIKATENQDRSKIRCIYDSFLKAPKSYGKKSKPIFVKNSRGKSKLRKNWGAKPLLVIAFEKAKLNLDKYVKILEKIENSKHD